MTLMAHSFILKMETSGSFEMLVTIYQILRRHVRKTGIGPENLSDNLQLTGSPRCLLEDFATVREEINMGTVPTVTGTILKLHRWK